jgi:aromatic ring-opening dioxygenase catalytic subunit (LigB family)
MTAIVLAYCSSHAPMMAAAADAAPRAQSDAFFAAHRRIRDLATERRPQAVIVVSNEHFTNFFFENFPQLCVGVGETNWGPAEAWLPIDHGWVPGHPRLALHVLGSVLDAGFDPSSSQELMLDHGVMTVYQQLDFSLRLPLVPIIQNCTVRPMQPLRRCLDFGRALGDAIRAFDGLERVAVVGAGGLSHWIGTPRVGDIDADFDRWFLDHLSTGDLAEVVDLSDDELEEAGNGAHEIRSWLAVAGAVAPDTAETLVYEPIEAWITGMAVAVFGRGS